MGKRVNKFGQGPPPFSGNARKKSILGEMINDGLTPMAMQTAFGLQGRPVHSSFVVFELSSLFFSDSFPSLRSPPPVISSPKNLSTSFFTDFWMSVFSASVWFSSKLGSSPMIVPVSCPVTTSISVSVTLLGRIDLELVVVAWETVVPLVIATIFKELEKGGRKRTSMFRMLKGHAQAKGEKEGRRWRLKSSRITGEGNNTPG